MISRFNWYTGALFFAAAFGTLINPSLLSAIALSLFSINLVLLATTNKSVESCPDWQIAGETKNAIVLVALITFCLIVPQASTDLARLFDNPVEQIKVRRV